MGHFDIESLTGAKISPEVQVDPHNSASRIHLNFT